MLLRVISGGQSGIDISALRAAKSVGLETGGCMPHGFRTLQNNRDTYRPDYAALYGMYEHASHDWIPRTRENVEKSDATLIIGTDLNSPGARATRKACFDHGKWFEDLWIRRTCFEGEMPAPSLSVGLIVSKNGVSTTQDVTPVALAALIHSRGWQTLNIAGNRDERMEGPVEAWLVEVFAELLTLETRETFGDKKGVLL